MRGRVGTRGGECTTAASTASWRVSAGPQAALSARAGSWPVGTWRPTTRRAGSAGSANVRQAATSAGAATPSAAAAWPGRRAAAATPAPAPLGHGLTPKAPSRPWRRAGTTPTSAVAAASAAAAAPAATAGATVAAAADVAAAVGAEAAAAASALFATSAAAVVTETSTSGGCGTARGFPHAVGAVGRTPPASRPPRRAVPVQARFRRGRDLPRRWRRHTLKQPLWRRPPPRPEAPPTAASLAAAGRRTVTLGRRHRLLRVQPINRKAKADGGVARAWGGGGLRRQPAQGPADDAPAPRRALPPPAANRPHRTEPKRQRRPSGALSRPKEPNAP